MKKYFVVVPVILFLSLVLSGCGYSTSSTSQVTTNQPNTVIIKNLAFNPASMTIAAGSEVTFTNNDSTTHTVTFDSFQSGNVAPGGSFKHTFDSAGTFGYHCSIHPSMQGTITVQ
jgi:plastocyanin